MTRDPTPMALQRIEHSAMLDRICDELYQLIAAAVVARVRTPTVAELAAALPSRTPGISQDAVGRLIRRLRLQGRIVIDNPDTARRYGLPGSPWRTAGRQRTSKPPATLRKHQAAGIAQAQEKTGWPRPTADSIAAYDTAMASRPYDRENIFPRSYLLQLRAHRGWRDSRSRSSLAFAQKIPEPYPKPYDDRQSLVPNHSLID